MIDPDAFDRTRALARLADSAFDVLVVGGGITGVGVALDAASRGLRTALVERDDFASGTSSKSSKLVHGGIRYLQQGDVRLVYEALAERQRLRRNAPHLVRTLPFLLPMFSKDGLIPKKLARAMGSAMWMYDLTGGARIGKLHKRISKAEALRHLPVLNPERLAASYLYYDAAADDARLTLEVARTAALDHGAVVVNRVEVDELLKDAEGRLRGARATADGEHIEIRAGMVVNATGVWADDVCALDEPHQRSTIRPAKGVHITVPSSKMPCDIAVVLPVPKDKRSIFVVPWDDRVYIGTTDTDYDGPLDQPTCTSEDVDYLLEATNYWITEPLGRREVLGTWAGLRPLVRGAGSARTADLSRRHRVTCSDSGLVTVTGGKLTTYREMAADTVDTVVEELGPAAPRSARRCRTGKLPLRGAVGADRARRLRSPHVDASAIDHLVGRHGSETSTILAMIDHDPSLGAPLVPTLPYLRAEAVYAARYEMATTLDDVLSRRTRARLLARDATAAAAPAVAELLAAELGWDPTETRAQLEDLLARLEAERKAADLPETALDAALGA